MYEMLSLSLYNQTISTEKQRSKHRRAVSLSPGSCTLFWHDAKEESLLNAHLRYVTDWNEVFRSDTAADLQWVKPKHFFFFNLFFDRRHSPQVRRTMSGDAFTGFCKRLWVFVHTAQDTVRVSTCKHLPGDISFTRHAFFFQSTHYYTGTYGTPDSHKSLCT